jgi:hypothetical protein
VPETVNATRLVELGGGISPVFPLQLDYSLRLSDHERSAWERRLNRGRRACGCAEGAAGLGAGILSVVIGWSVLTPPLAASSIITASAVPIACLAAGKLIGRRLHRKRFHEACKELAQRLGVG